MKTRGGARAWGPFGAWALALALAHLGPSSASAQLLRPIDASDRLFVTLEKLQAFGVLDTIPVGQRFGLERILQQATRGWSSNSGNPTVSRPAMSDLVQEFERLIGRASLEAEVELSYAWANVRARAVPDNGLGGIAASTVPLAEERGGRVLEDGPNWTFEPALGWRSGAWSGVIRGRAQRNERHPGGSTEARIQEAWAEGPLGPVYVSVGRAPVVWGQSPSGGHMHSGQAGALDQVSVGTDGAVRLPWILRHMGPTRLSLTVARLEGARAIPHSFIVSYKISYRPVPSLELGVGVLNHSGGEGAPSASFGRRLLDYLVLAERFTDDPDLEISNLLTGFDVRWRVPATRGSQVYGAMTIDDFGFNAELGRVFREDASYLVGLAIPRLTPDGRVGVRGEFRQTGIRFYRHAQFTSGLTFHGVVLGDPLGPDGRGSYLSVVGRPNNSHRFTLALAHETRSGDYYAYERDADGYMEFTKVDDRPEETRIRLDASWERDWAAALPGGVTTQIRAGYERVSDFDFRFAGNQSGAVAEARVTVGLARAR